MKLDPVKVEWIVRQKEKGELTNWVIAERMEVSPLRVKVLWKRYSRSGQVPTLMKPGRRIECVFPSKKRIFGGYVPAKNSGTCIGNVAEEMTMKVFIYDGFVDRSMV